MEFLSREPRTVAFSIEVSSPEKLSRIDLYCVHGYEGARRYWYRSPHNSENTKPGEPFQVSGFGGFLRRSPWSVQKPMMPLTLLTLFITSPAPGAIFCTAPCQLPLTPCSIPRTTGASFPVTAVMIDEGLPVWIAFARANPRFTVVSASEFPIDPSKVPPPPTPRP